MAKIGFRTPSPKRSIKARTTGAVTRSIKRKASPGYGKKGIGWVKDPKRAAYNAVYSRTTTSVAPKKKRSASTSTTKTPTKADDTKKASSAGETMSRPGTILVYIVIAVVLGTLIFNLEQCARF